MRGQMRKRTVAVLLCYVILMDFDLAAAVGTAGATFSPILQPVRDCAGGKMDCISGRVLPAGGELHEIWWILRRSRVCHVQSSYAWSSQRLQDARDKGGRPVRIDTSQLPTIR